MRQLRAFTRQAFSDLEPGASFFETVLVKFQVAVLQMVKTLQGFSAKSRVAKRIGIKSGGNDLFATSGLSQPPGNRVNDHAVAEIVAAAGIRPYRIGGDHVNVVIVGPGRIGEMPDVKAAQQGRWPDDNLGALDRE